MNQSSPSTTPSFSFPEAIAKTQELMQQMVDNQLSEEAIPEAIANLVKSQTGARGFFVAYLTGDLSLADDPTQGVIEGLQSSPEIVSDLLVKNVAMSAAMRLTHLRNDDETAAAGSQRVNRRTVKLIQKLKMTEIEQEIQDLKSTIVKGEGNYQEFLTRWGYDEEQQAEIKQAISSINI
ncbi:conserved hypothetical protein [Hyella patelloides LEGE 07179]|uniref:Uncharacterized protein n=1 Tax=Hyella patelloides LEGE 07179 TaxID=945734 RepID=A0A563W0W6_9CYAN|nr:hypothetical protein [Hyella patelloides]VEP17183.1 conserved hypothetical protein [Hyella patelloides LEGE 07179]